MSQSACTSLLTWATKHSCCPLRERARGCCADVDRMLVRAEPMDLAVNVFKDGVWGTLRCGPLQPSGAYALP